MQTTDHFKYTLNLLILLNTRYIEFNTVASKFSVRGVSGVIAIRHNKNISELPDLVQQPINHGFLLTCLMKN